MWSTQPNTDDRPFMGGAHSGVRFELTGTDDGEPPFVVLDDTGRFSRVLHGALRLGSEHTLLEVALKMQRDAYHLSGAEYAALTNTAIDDMWQREVADYRRIQSDRVIASVPLTGSNKSLPVLHCRERKVYFHPPCPRTGNPLRVCSDDDGLLQDCGLRPYRTSLQRYLWGGPLVGGGAGAGGQVFYKRTALDDERPRGDVKVRVGTELFADLGPVAHGEVECKTWFPCRGCSERDSCYPRSAKSPALAPQRLVPLSYYDFAFVVLPALPLGYGELCDVLGGAPWAAVKQRAVALGGRGRTALLATLDRRLDGKQQWLQHSDNRLAHTLEVLRAKLTAFLQVIEGMAAVHATCGRPHLGIEPRNVMATLVDAGPAVPARWAARVQLIDLGAARQFVPAHPSRKDMPLRFVPDGSSAYTDPLTHAGDGVAKFAQVRVERVTTDEHGKRVDLRALFAPDVRLQGYRPGDLVAVMLTAEIWVWAEAVSIEDSTMSLIAEKPAPRADSLLVEQREFSTHVSVYKTLGPPSDLYGLGMLLFRMLLTNDEHVAARVEELAARCAAKLMSEVEENALTPQMCRDYLARRMSEQEGVFHYAAVLWRRADRTGDIEGFPTALWADLLMFGVRLMTKVPGFSFADAHADNNPHNPVALATLVTQEFNKLLARTHTELFARSRRDDDLGQLCRGMLDEIREVMLVDDTAPGGRGEP